MNDKQSRVSASVWWALWFPAGVRWTLSGLPIRNCQVG